MIRKELLKELEPKNKTLNDWCADLESKIKTIFPKSMIWVKVVEISKHVVVIEFSIGKNKSEYDWGQVDNDPARHKFIIHLPNGVTGNSELPDKMQIKLLIGGSVVIKPPKGSHYSIGRAKVGFRNKTGKPDAIFKHVIDYFTKLKTVWKANVKNLSDAHAKLVGKKY